MRVWSILFNLNGRNNNVRMVVNVKESVPQQASAPIDSRYKTMVATAENENQGRETAYIKDSVVVKNDNEDKDSVKNEDNENNEDNVLFIIGQLK